MSSLREREKREGKDSRGDVRKRQGSKRKRNESEELKHSHLPLPASRIAGLAHL